MIDDKAKLRLCPCDPSAANLPLPANLPREVWHEWLRYRQSEIKKPYKTKRGPKGTLKILARCSDPVAAIEFTMDNEWIQVVIPNEEQQQQLKNSEFEHFWDDVEGQSE